MRRRAHLFAAGALSVACTSTPKAPPPEPPDAMPGDALSDDAGWTALGDWDGIPLLGRGGSRRFSSYDRDPNSAYPLTDPGNKDANNFLAVCGDRAALLFQVVDGAGPCDAGQEGHLIAAADDGPGYVSRIFLAAGTVAANVTTVDGIQIGFANERVRVFVDDADAPVYEGAIADWESGNTAPFPVELTTMTSGAVVSYAPISYQSKVRVFIDDLRRTSIYYYQVDVHSVERTVGFDPDAVSTAGAERFAALRRARDTNSETWRSERVSVPAGATTPLLSRDAGGTIRTLELALPGAPSTALSDLTLRVVWDAAAAPAIDLPLSRLFGAAPSPASFDTLPMSVQVADAEVTLTLRLPMPFRSRAALTLANLGSGDHEISVRIDGSDGSPSAPFGRLHATPSQQSAPVSAGDRYVVADLAGRGKYAGTIFSFEGTRDPDAYLSDTFNFLEADETLTVDGAVTAQGTGTEEFVNGGFYFVEGRFDFPFSTVIARETETMLDGTTSGRARGVRWHVLSDSIHFEDSFRLDFEYGANRPVTMLEYSAVAFHYRE